MPVSAVVTVAPAAVVAVAPVAVTVAVVVTAITVPAAGNAVGGGGCAELMGKSNTHHDWYSCRASIIHHLTTGVSFSIFQKFQTTSTHTSKLKTTSPT